MVRKIVALIANIMNILWTIIIFKVLECMEIIKCCFNYSRNSCDYSNLLFNVTYLIFF